MKTFWLFLLISALFTGLFTSCDSSSQGGTGDRNAYFKKGKEKFGLRDYAGAIECFEKALQQDPTLAKAHLEMALIYDDQFKDHISAIYHFRKYKALKPDSDISKMVDGYMASAYRNLTASISTTFTSEKEEIQRLKLENNLLRTELADLRRKYNESAPPAQEPSPVAHDALSGQEAAPAAQTAAPTTTSPTAAPPPTTIPAPGQRTYTVKPGDTLTRISKKFYGNSSDWRKIVEANPDLKDPHALKAGQIIVIP